MQGVWDWLAVNPARYLVLISLVVTWLVCLAEYQGRHTGGSGWLTLARISVGSIFTLITAVVAGFFGGVGAFFGYLVLQIFVCVVIPLVWVD
ncbi:hypothetical protein [Pusillimonas sp. NJUB218]|uniref:hypothetical protein n=1 Tax=Pusillimonas sp. NJUB218 TaxID=2023230 RepID=UPI000F4D1405|nr:hypothetical protein [Pusillimonas sp. NJUB218]ROT43918.1 hypothetical protein CHR62_15175 [Pusillimonas sp. NJUB218]